MSQAPRIPPAVWEAQRPRITELYVNQDKTLDEVIQIMAESGFHATKPQYIRKVNVNWKLQKNYTKEKWQHASALVAKRQAEGKLTELRIDGKVISEKRRKKELNRYHGLHVEENFVSTNIDGVVALTPQPSNSRVVLINGLPWLKFRESFTNRIKSQPPLFGPNQKDGSLGFWEVANTLLSSVHTTEGMATGSLPLPEPPRHVSSEVSKHLGIKVQRLFELVPMLDDSVEIIRHQEPPWLQIFNSLVFLCSNNLMETESSAYELLQVAISSGFLIKMKHLFTLSVPTLEIFARHLLFVALGVKGSRGIETLRFLLESGVSPDSTDPNDCTYSVLRKAVRLGDHVAVRLLLQFGANPNEKLEGTEDNTPDTLLNYALEWGADKKIVKMIIESGADVNFESQKLLIQAFRRGDSALVRYLLEAGADLKMLLAEGLSVLCFAIEYQNLSLVNILIEAGVRPNLLIDELHDEDIEYLKDELDMLDTPLRYAVFVGNVGIVKRLIEGGAVLDLFIDPEKLNEMDRSLLSSEFFTPLQVSVQERAYEITKVLLDAGAGVDFRHPTTGTALQLVCSSPVEEEGKKIELTKVLLAKGADINSLPGEPGGRTAMQAAAEYGDYDLLKLLFTRGGNPFAPAAKKDGLTVFQAALKSHSAELVAYVFWELGSSCSCFSFFDGTNYLGEAVSTGSLQLLETVLKFWKYHGLHWPNEFISSALKIAIRSRFIYRILGLGAEPFTVRLFTMPEEELNSMICESISNDDKRTFDWLIERFVGTELDLAQPGYSTPLWTALHEGNKYMAERLLNAGANPNEPSVVVCRKGYSRCCHYTGPEMPLKQAICRFDNFIELLTDRGANIHCLIDGSLTPLLLSLQRRKEYAAVFLLSKGVDPNVVDVSGRYTALGCALDRQAFLSTVQVLIQRGADVNRPSVWGMPLEQAARGPFWHHDAIERCQLLLTAGADVNADIGSTALKSAVASGHVELVKFLMGAGADVNASKTGKTVLEVAVHKNNTELVKFLMGAGADVNASKTGKTVLEVAVHKNNTELAKLLVEAGASFDTSSVQISALQLAFRKNDLELAALFLAKGADINDSTLGETLLQRAANLGNLELVKNLIDLGADVDAKVAGSPATALQYASMHGSVEIVKYLIEHGASVNEEASPFYEATALGLAVDDDHTEVALYLIKKGASIDKYPTAGGVTLLQLAAEHGNHEIVTCLVENGAEVNAAPAAKGGATALQFAAINGNIKMAVFLLENGAYASAKGSEVEGRTALEGAAEHGRLDMVHLLLDNDEEPDTIEERCRDAAEFAEAERHDVVARILRDYRRP
ncbi:ankyrin protein [Fusarium mundagurra]|uniref:Ankyrin protein n=1 Tax=Fusarium mundagurra TaxID=1567541 RepID=A0A8H5Z1V5_9HYPO|nr:ankyrin protein [Fusarium mundagurra]